MLSPTPHYLCIPLSILAMEAPSLNAKVLLADVISMYQSTGKVFASDDHYAERYSVSKRSIGDAMKWLEEAGWITREIDHSARTKRAVVPTRKAVNLFKKSMQNLHEVPAKSASSPRKICKNSLQNLHGVLAESADYNNSLIKQINNTLSGATAPSASASNSAVASPASTPKPSNQLPAESAEADRLSFEAFWQAYDKKADRVKCQRKWATLSPNVREAILTHVPRYVAATPEKKFRKDPYTYLNGQNWQDEELPSTRTQPSSSTTPPPASLANKLRTQRQAMPL